MALKTIALIPARYDSGRFPGKLMHPLEGKSVIRRTYENALATGLFQKVCVATDNDLIAEEITNTGGLVFRSKRTHDCGSDRIAEAATEEDADIVVNVQGDEPFMDKSSLKKLIAAFEEDKKQEIDLASLMNPLKEGTAINNPNVVKVIVDLNNFALYFSRHPIPYSRSPQDRVSYYKHRGVYAFRREALVAFSKHPMTPLEKAEKIECIRFLEMGRKIKMIETLHEGIGIDTKEDLEKAKDFLREQAS